MWQLFLRNFSAELVLELQVFKQLVSKFLLSQKDYLR